MEASKGKKEFRRVKDDPRHVTPIISKIDPRRYTLGVTKRKSMLVVAPVNPKHRSNLLR